MTMRVLRLVRVPCAESWIPDEEAAAKCPVYVSEGWEVAEKLLVVFINQPGGTAGLWSRSLCFSHGVKAGAMLDVLARARSDGFGVLVLNPNVNSVLLAASDAQAAAAGGAFSVAEAEAQAGGARAAAEARPKKVPIEDSRTPEEHTVGVVSNGSVIRSKLGGI